MDSKKYNYVVEIWAKGSYQGIFNDYEECVNTIYNLYKNLYEDDEDYDFTIDIEPAGSYFVIFFEDEYFREEIGYIIIAPIGGLEDCCKL